MSFHSNICLPDNLNQKHFEGLQSLAGLFLYNRTEVTALYRGRYIRFKFTSRKGINRHIRMTVDFVIDGLIERHVTIITENRFNEMTYDKLTSKLDTTIEQKWREIDATGKTERLYG